MRLETGERFASKKSSEHLQSLRRFVCWNHVTRISHSDKRQALVHLGPSSNLQQHRFSYINDRHSLIKKDNKL